MVGFLVTGVIASPYGFRAVSALKTLLASASSILIGFPMRIAVLAGLTVSQVEGFSFLLSRTGVEHGLLNADSFRLFIAVSLVTIAATPVIISSSHTTAAAIAGLPRLCRLRPGRYVIQDESRTRLSDDIIIVGYGVIG